MKKNLLFVFIAMIITSCAHHVKIMDERQISSMSRQAQDSLKSFKYYRIPLINLNNKQKIKIREQWNRYEKWMLDDMHERFSFTTRDTIVAGTKVVIIQPKTILAGKENIIGFHIHGGGFMMGTPYERAAMLMANEYGYIIYSVDYSLSPEVKYPVAIHECLDVYKELAQKFPDKKIVSSSISAGGQIMQSALLRAQAENLRMPEVNILYTPAMDLAALGDSHYHNDGRDAIAMKNSGDKMFKNLYLTKNTDPKDPLVSPVYANYKGSFPPTILSSGTRDIFLSASTRTFWKMREGDIDTELLVGEGGWHAYQYYPDIPEAIAARKAIYQFMDKYLK